MHFPVTPESVTMIIREFGSELLEMKENDTWFWGNFTRSLTSMDMSSNRLILRFGEEEDGVLKFNLLRNDSKYRTDLVRALQGKGVSFERLNHVHLHAPGSWGVHTSSDVEKGL